MTGSFHSYLSRTLINNGSITALFQVLIKLSKEEGKHKPHLVGLLFTLIFL
ncbi:conserved hypothetical protein [delta proteobacterium NaphS2]|nr:conserved hypothetical protein [delta proteobacterium NaphS2]